MDFNTINKTKDYTLYKIQSNVLELPKNLKPFKFDIMFFHANLANEFKLLHNEEELFISVLGFNYKITKIDYELEEIYSIIDELKESINNRKNKAINYNDYKILFSNRQKSLSNNKEQNLEIISYMLRNSHTLKINDDNSIFNDSIELVISELGMYLDSALPLQRFRIMLIYILAITYIKNLENFIIKSASYKNKEEMIKNRHELLEYEVRYFFKNPIKYSRYELYNIYELITKNYKINELHYEIKEQIKDSAKILELELVEEKQRRYKYVNVALIAVTFASLIPIIDAAKNIWYWIKDFINL